MPDNCMFSFYWVHNCTDAEKYSWGENLAGSSGLASPEISERSEGQFMANFTNRGVSIFLFREIFMGRESSWKLWSCQPETYKCLKSHLVTNFTNPGVGCLVFVLSTLYFFKEATYFKQIFSNFCFYIQICIVVS